RELEALQGLRERLCQMRGHELHARESLRVETDLPVWISRKLQVVPTAGDEDGVLDEAAPVGGHLVDLSEGGAAMRADEAFGRGDVLEVWSADANTPLPPMAAAVVDVQDDGEEGGPLLHLHFIDPPTIELVELHRELQAEAQASAAEPEAGTAPAAPRRSDQMA
ncbi:MAG: PilZ domain-containing protein, partial [Gemmatimonadota bacterium]